MNVPSAGAAAKALQWCQNIMRPKTATHKLYTYLNKLHKFLKCVSATSYKYPSLFFFKYFTDSIQCFHRDP